MKAFAMLDNPANSMLRKLSVQSINFEAGQGFPRFINLTQFDSRSVTHLSPLDFKANIPTLTELGLPSSTVRVIDVPPLSRLDLSFNGFTEWPPASWLKESTTVSLSDNQLTGEIPNYPIHPTVFNVYNNIGVNGTVPDMLCSIDVMNKPLRDTSVTVAPDCMYCYWTLINKDELKLPATIVPPPSLFECIASLDKYNYVKLADESGFEITGRNIGYAFQNDVTAGLTKRVPNYNYAPSTPSGEITLEFSKAQGVKFNITWNTDPTKITSGGNNQIPNALNITLGGVFDASIAYDFWVNSVKCPLSPVVQPNMVYCLWRDNIDESMPMNVTLSNQYQSLSINTSYVKIYPVVKSVTPIDTDGGTLSFYGYFGEARGINVMALIQHSPSQRVVEFAMTKTTLPPNSIKIAVNITGWRYHSTLNTLRVVFSTQVGDIAPISPCGDEDNVYGDPMDNMLLNYLHVIKGNTTFYGHFLPMSLSDGRPTYSKNEVINQTTDTTLIGINMPQCSSCLIDPDFSVLINTVSSTSTCSTKSKAWIIATIVCVVGVMVIGAAIGSWIFYKRHKRFKLQNAKMEQKLKAINENK
eukprot:gene19007-22752_t